ncbi:unnamed protein product [Adineta ricciae]|uniref:Uncharacterized protein n=1 Tax=Adineta ricciae TaxID=249248 RepID=A0A814CVE7_ADIRI|nr:unnamed protein product [Adineta ricciae]CAF0947314.1 unnamed protein product [Adineta ricciae]
MHSDTRLVFLISIIFNGFTPYFCQYSDHESYLSLIEFNRGGSATNLILSSPHGGFLGANSTIKSAGKSFRGETISTKLEQLPVAGCYNDTLDRCVYTIQDCLKHDGTKVFHRSDARCLTNRGSSLSMYLLTKAISEAIALPYRPYTILNKLARQYVDPAEDLLIGTFLIESATRVYSDYHRLIAMAKEAIRAPLRGLFIELIFHQHSQTVQLGYGYDPLRSSVVNKPTQSTINELVSRSGPSIILGNNSFGYFLRLNGFPHIIPLEQAQQQRQNSYRVSTYSTRMHADQRFNALVLSYPIERLRTNSIQLEAKRIAKAIEQFMLKNNIKSLSSSSSSTLFRSYTVTYNLFLFCIFSLLTEINRHY